MRRSFGREPLFVARLLLVEFFLISAPSKSIALTPDAATLFTYTFMVSPMLLCRKIA